LAGLTNVNHLVEHGGERVVVRLPGGGTSEYIDRVAEAIAARSAAGADVHQRLLAAIATLRVVRLRYHAGYSAETTERDAEPIGLYYRQHWHLIAFCRLRQAFRDFRLDRIAHFHLLSETFAPRPETLQQYWQQLADRRPQHVAVVRFSATAAGRVRDDKHHFGWAHEEVAPDGCIEMTLLPGDLPYLARWLLTLAGHVKVVAPPALSECLRELACVAYQQFAPPGLMAALSRPSPQPSCSTNVNRACHTRSTSAASVCQLLKAARIPGVSA
ncbi:MAG: WYL domain-containing protein, partial [Hymenobacteraceae bacterium]|nr:WYL domain-containing protein [Hymenobacteraceae bacterium]